MDDLLGEDWQSASKPTTSNPPLNPTPFASNYSSLRGSPALTPSITPVPQTTSRPSSTLNGGAKPPPSDQFGNLFTAKAQKVQSSGLSMQERQKQMLEERRRQQEQQSQMWDSLGSGRGTPEVRGPSPSVTQQETEDDILAAFNRAAPVDNASHYPPPASTAASGRSTPAHTPSQAASTISSAGFDDKDDDFFGLKSIRNKSNGHAKPSVPAAGDEDDILGDLGRPVTSNIKSQRSTPAHPPDADLNQNLAKHREDSPRDLGVAELVDMGFPADTAKIALAENGGDVQNAVGWLLQQAHEESKQKAQKARGEVTERAESPRVSNRSPQRRSRAEPDALPSWMQQESRSSSTARRQDNRSPAGGDKDTAQVAQEFGSKFLKGAGSLWKASQKQMAKTMAEFQQERDPSQPKWMKDASSESSRSSSQRREPEKPSRRQAEITNEAALLDMPRERPQKPTRPAVTDQEMDLPSRSRTPMESLPHRPTAQSRPVEHAPPTHDRRPTTKLSRQEVEDQTAQAYVSPARRKRPTPKPEPLTEPEIDLFGPAPAKASTVPTAARRPAQTQSVSRPSPAITPKPKAPLRSVPSVSPASLSTSAAHRKAGGEAFKRGDYASAHEAYTAALAPLPSTHPITIVVLSNRCLTALKTGDAKTAVTDADQALSIIGISLGVGESIDLGAGEGTKDMREFYGKALMRKAEALEHLEKWTDAAGVWRLAIEAGAGGAVSLRGRDRCEKAAAPKPVTAVRPAPRGTSAMPSTRAAPPAKSLGNSLQRPALSNVASGEAVKKLRAANAAADKADDEKFALTDQVDAKLTTWKGGKADNLRALLQSLDTVLWPAAGWKKVGMSDLVMPNKVKIVYMKAIAKVHPDKVCFLSLFLFCIHGRASADMSASCTDSAGCDDGAAYAECFGVQYLE